MPCGIALWGQTTQGLISGRIVSSVNGRSIAGASVEYAGLVGIFSGKSTSDDDGFYYLPLLSPGMYRIRVEAAGFQSQEIHELELAVAARLEVDFRARPLSDVWESGQYKSVFLPGARTIVTFFGPDVDTSRSGSFEARKGRMGALESTISAVIDSGAIENLPLAGRDVYTMLVTQPGVTSDAGTARGLGLSINGQRPSASNYLLDGLENNNYLITGPLTRVPPEAIQEYRVSTNNFSAEYGRTSGFLANAITRSGSNAFHGLVYFYGKMDVLNANGFQENLSGSRRMPYREIQPGFVFGGPVPRSRLLFSSTFERFGSRGLMPEKDFLLPASGLFTTFPGEGSRWKPLLTRYPAPFAASVALNANVKIAQPSALDRTVAIGRMDYHSPGGKDRLMGRLMISKVANPDFIWTPYKDFITPLHQDTYSAGFTLTHRFPSLTSESRFGYSTDTLYWDRAHPEIPTLVSPGPFGAILPGSPAFYSYRNANRGWEVVENVLWSRGRHLFVAGAGFLARGSEGYLTAGEDGEFTFASIATFALDRPASARTAVERTSLPRYLRPDSNRTFGYEQSFGFVQDTYKASPRLTVNFGLRYEVFGAPANTGAVKDALLTLGRGEGLAEQLASAGPLKLPPRGDQKYFGTDKSNWAGRAGASYDLFGNARTLLRGGYGIFYDRPFDNLWQNTRNNNFILPAITQLPANFDYLQPNAQILPALPANRFPDTTFPGLTAADPELRNGYAHSYFAGVRQRAGNSLSFEVNAMGSFGRRLISTDIVNRDFSTDAGRYNQSLPDISYRSNQGSSNYNALTVTARHRAPHGALQAQYTWSHVLDTQSDPLTGDFFDLNFTNLRPSGTQCGRAAFPIQFSPESNRGNSDFDQRHNFVVWSYWEIPAPAAHSKLAALLRGWSVAQLAAFRTGLPFNIVGASDVEFGKGLIWNDRPDLAGTAPVVLAAPIAVAGGAQLLDKAHASLRNAAPSKLGSLGRNVFHGPGLYNLDLSISRAFPLRWLGETGRITFRADAFNALNHANLNNPDALLTSDTYGQAKYGRQGASNGFPASSPLNETARQIQLSLRLMF